MSENMTEEEFGEPVFDRYLNFDMTQLAVLLAVYPDGRILLRDNNLDKETVIEILQEVIRTMPEKSYRHAL